MNDNNLINNESNQGKYHATRNLNTAIENPKINVNSVTGVNIKDISSANNISDNDTIASYFNDGNGLNTSTVDNNEILNPSIPTIDNTNNNINASINNIPEENVTNIPSYEQQKKQVHYEPTLKEKKTQKQNLKIPTELLVMFLVVIILLVVVIVIPYIHEVIQKIQLNLTR